MSGRQTQIAAFLAGAGWSIAQAVPLAGDASNRRYLRLARGAAGAVLMDAPPERGEDVCPFLKVSAALHALGLSAPQILAADETAGLVLLEDLGDDLYARHCARAPADEPMLYAAAVDVLAALGAAPPPGWLAPYDEAALLREAALLTDWYLPAVGAAPSQAARAEFLGLVAEAAGTLGGVRPVMVLRDYHAENLVWLAARDGLARVGLLDYQDALAGHPAYDLVSLLEDARRDTAPALRATMRARFAAATGIGAEELAHACAVLGAQRNAKIIGIFARLSRRDGKHGYLDLIPRVWRHLQGDLAHPALGNLRRWVQACVPAPEPAALARIRGAA